MSWSRQEFVLTVDQGGSSGIAAGRVEEDWGEWQEATGKGVGREASNSQV